MSSLTICSRGCAKAGVIVLLTVSLFAFAKSAPQPLSAEFAERDGLLYRGSDPFTGVHLERYPSGDVYRETRYLNGLREGESKEFALGGKLRARWNFHAGKKDGFQEGWFIEGPKRFESNFKNGVLDGLQTEWHLNGALFRRQVFADGVETDKKILFPTAEVFSNYTKRDGRIYGLDGGALCFERKKEGEKE